MQRKGAAPFFINGRYFQREYLCIGKYIKNTYSLQSHIPIISRPRNLQRAANLADADACVLAHLLCHQHARIIRCCLWPAALLASCSCGCEPCHGALLNKPPLKLRQRCKNIENHFAGCGCGINAAVID